MFVRISGKSLIVICSDNVLIEYRGRLAKVKVSKMEDVDKLARMFDDISDIVKETILAGLKEEGVVLSS